MQPGKPLIGEILQSPFPAHISRAHYFTLRSKVDIREKGGAIALLAPPWLRPCECVSDKCFALRKCRKII